MNSLHTSMECNIYNERMIKKKTNKSSSPRVEVKKKERMKKLQPHQKSKLLTDS